MITVFSVWSDTDTYSISPFGKHLPRTKYVLHILKSVHHLIKLSKCTHLCPTVTHLGLTINLETTEYVARRTNFPEERSHYRATNKRLILSMGFKTHDVNLHKAPRKSLFFISKTNKLSLNML